MGKQDKEEANVIKYDDNDDDDDGGDDDDDYGYDYDDDDGGSDDDTDVYYDGDDDDDRHIQEDEDEEIQSPKSMADYDRPNIRRLSLTTS